MANSRSYFASTSSVASIGSDSESDSDVLEPSRPSPKKQCSSDCRPSKCAASKPSGSIQ